MDQLSLFDRTSAVPSRWPEGLVYEEEWLTRDDEAALIAFVRQLPFEHAKYKSYTARRRVVSYGGSYDYDANRLLPAAPLLAGFHALRDRVVRWAGIAPESLTHGLIAEYAPGTPLGWHRDVAEFEDVIGVSLGSVATMRFRPYPPRSPAGRDGIDLPIAPRSIYAMRGPARWGWQHSISPVEALRWSITLRTNARPRARTLNARRISEEPE